MTEINETLNGRINFAYVTSCREIGSDELVGRIVRDSMNGKNYGYREGCLENLARRLGDGDNEFGRRFNLVAVIVDDDDEQYKKAWSQAEIWPRNLDVPIRNNKGNIIAKPTLEQLTVRIPAQHWKDIRRADSESAESFKARKAEAKAMYEYEILGILRETNADLAISDSYMTIFGPLLLKAYGERILNIHPAITKIDDSDRLPGHTPTRDAYTRAVYGYLITDDKKNPKHKPNGREDMVGYYKYNPDTKRVERELRKAVYVPKSNRTGVTVHIVSEDVDDGPVVKYLPYQFNPNGVTPEAIRTMNYERKIELLTQAMLEYVERPEVQILIAERRNHNNDSWSHIKR